MELLNRYRQAVDDLFAKVRESQTENIIKVGTMIADCVTSGGKVYMGEICHAIQKDLSYRGGGPIFYKEFNKDEHMDKLKKGDILILSSVSGRTASVVELAWEAMEKGVTVIAFTSMSYATQVDPVHPSGKKLYEFVSVAIDNCAPAAEAMLEVEGLEARFAAASGIASDYIMWSITAVAVETMLSRGYTPGILKSANYPGGNDYNTQIIEPHYAEFGW